MQSSIGRRWWCHWAEPLAASNIFFLPSIPDMASTFFLQSLSSTGRFWRQIQKDLGSLFLCHAFNLLCKHTFPISSGWHQRKGNYTVGWICVARMFPFCLLVHTPFQCPLFWQTWGWPAGPWRLCAWSPAASGGWRQQTHGPASDWASWIFPSGPTPWCSNP